MELLTLQLMLVVVLVCMCTAAHVLCLALQRCMSLVHGGFDVVPCRLRRCYLRAACSVCAQWLDLLANVHGTAVGQGQVQVQIQVQG